MKHYDVVIIGAGVVGLCSAYYLGKAGKSVLVLDSGDGSDGCSYGNAGLISPSHFVPLSAPGIVSKGLKWMMSSNSPFFIKPRLSYNLVRWGWNFMKHATDEHVNNTKKLLADLAVLSRALHKEIASESKQDIQEKGTVMLCNTKEALNHEIEYAKMALDLGMTVETLSLNNLNNLDPGIRKDAVGGVFYANDAFTDPTIFMNNITKLLKQYDVTIKYKSEVDNLETKDDHVVSAFVGGQTFSADQFVMAAGSFSQSLMKNLGLTLLLEPGKGYSVDWTSPAVIPDVSYILVEARVAVTPLKNRVRLAGTMELGGFNKEINNKRVHGFLKSIEAYFPQFQFESLKNLPVWGGLRPCSPDGLPYIGRTNKYNNLILATGHAMLGFTLGPVTGQLVKEIALEEKPSFKIDLLSANRY